MAPIRTSKKALATTKSRFSGMAAPGQTLGGTKGDGLRGAASNQANKESKAQLSHDSSGFGRGSNDAAGMKQGQGKVEKK